MQRIDLRRLTRELFAGAAKATLAVAIGFDRAIQGLRIEVGPEFVGKIELGVSKLPEQEITDALLAAGADEKIRFRSIVHREIRGQVRFAIAARRLGHVARHAVDGLKDVPAT